MAPSALQARVKCSRGFNSWVFWALMLKGQAACACISFGDVLASNISWCWTLEPIWVDATLNNLTATCRSALGSTFSIRKSQFWWRVCLWPCWFLMMCMGTSTSTWLHTVYTSSSQRSFSFLYLTNGSFLMSTTSPLFSVTVEAFQSYLLFCLSASIWVIFWAPSKAFLRAAIRSAT